MSSEAPVCTCIAVQVPGTTLKAIKVIDPYCQIDTHKARGTYTGPEPTYGKAGP